MNFDYKIPDQKKKTFKEKRNEKKGRRQKFNSIQCNYNQKVHFQILIRRSTLHLALETDATVGDLPFGVTPLMSSHVTLIPTFLLFKLSIFTFTFVSIWISSGIPLFLFRSDLNDVVESVSRSCDAEMIARNVVSFFFSLVNAGIVPLPIWTELEEAVRVKAS